MQSYGYQKFLEEEVRTFKVGVASFTVGDRFEIISPKKYSGEKGCFSGYHRDDSPEFWVKLDNHDLQIRVFPNQVKFLEDKKAMSTTTPKENAECNNSHNLTSAQELVQDSPLPPQSLDLTSLEPQRLTPTVAASSQSDSQNCITTAIYENSLTLEPSDCDQEQLILSPLPHPALHSPQKGNVKEPMTNEIVSPQSSKLLQITNPDLPLLKTSQGCSLAPIAQEMSAVTSGTFFTHFPPAGTMRNGLLSEAATVMLPSLESEYCWLPSPGALSLSGKGRPPGQTKQEAGLKDLGAIASSQVVNPEFLESSYALPLGWTDPRENRSALELLAEMEASAVAVPPSEMPLTGELPPLDFAASPTSTPYAENQQLQFKAITLHEPWAYLVAKVSTGENPRGAFRGRYKWFETRDWTTNYRGKIAIHAAKYQKDTDHWCSLLKDLLPSVEELVFSAVVAIADLTDCILITEEFINQQSETELRCGNWKPGRYAWKLENIQILTEPISAKGKQGLWNIELLIPSIECTQQLNHVSCPSCESPLLTLNNGCGVCGWIPENFLEESEPQPEAMQQPKGRQRKGCLYRYIENKKLKNGTIASYPRVIGHREPSNPHHWRWGFNWEEKIDGEWKGRSIGSVPLGAIALIQSMQNEGVSLEEIIGFIRRAKAKK